MLFSGIAASSERAAHCCSPRRFSAATSARKVLDDGSDLRYTPTHARRDLPRHRLPCPPRLHSTARVIRRGDEVLGSCEWVTTAWAGVSGKGSRRGEWVITRVDGSCVRGDHDTLADVRAAFA